MRVITAANEVIELGVTETTPTIGITDYSRRVTDDFGVTTVVKRGFSRTLSVRCAVPFDGVDAIQRRLADLRATAATWVADDRFAALGVKGFYKDFNLDLAVPPVSYCTLTIEGLAETEAGGDPGGDPAPDGQASTLQLLQPVPVSGTALVATNVPENDHPKWLSGTTYGLGERVIKLETHRVYESAAAGNVGNDPAGPSGKWLDVGPTTRWAMFDEALGTATTAAGTIAVTVDVGAVNAVALLDVVGSAVRVQAPGYDRTLPVGEGAITFLDLPGSAGQVTVTVAGPSQVSVGTLLVGNLVSLGITEASPTAGIRDFSRKEVDDFGEVTVVERAWAKQMASRALIRTAAIDMVFNRIAAVRARPSLWIGQAGLDSLTIYGFFKDFSIEVGEATSKLSLSVEGLSKAVPIKPLSVDVAWPNIADPDGTKPDDNATNSADPNSPFGPSSTVGAFLAQLDTDIQDLRDATSTDLDAPGQPSGLTLISSVKNDPKTGAPLISLALKWTANTEADMAGYELQVQEGTGGFVTYSAISNSYTLTGVAANTSYTAKVRAYDKAGNRSAFSAPVSTITVGDDVPPAAPTSLTVTPGIGALVVRCIAPADADVATVRVWSNTGGDFAGANLAAVLNAEPGQPVSTSRVVPPGEGRWFWVEAVDTSGNVSPRLGPVSGVSGKVDAAEMADGIIDQTKIAQGLQLPQLAMTANMNDGSVVAVRPGAFAFNVVDGMVYRNSDAAHPATSWIPATANLNFVVGKLTAGSIAAYAIGTQQLAARAVTANNLAVVGESLFPDGQLQDHEWWLQNIESNDVNAYMWYDPGVSAEYRNNINAAGSPTCWVINSDSYKGTAGDVRLVSQSLPGVTGGKFYEIACRASNFGSATRTLMFIIQWFDGSKNYLPNYDVLVGSAAPGEIAKALIRQVQAAPGAAYYRLYWTYQGTGIIPYGAGAYFGGITMREAAGGTLVVDGAITARHLTVDSIMANSMIANASTVTGAFAAKTIASLDTLPGRLTVDNNGFNLSTMASFAFDPAARVNANTTSITSGRIALGGSGASLNNWLYGGDNSLLNGGAIAANTLRANSAVIGLRGVQVIDIAFDTNRLNTVGWSEGHVEWQDDAGNRQVSQINGGSFTFDTNNPVQVVYVWFDRIASHANHILYAGMPAGGAAEILSNPNNVVLATYRYGTTLAVYYGRTIIDGDIVKTGTVQADRLVANSITGTYIAGGTITGDKIAAETILAGNIRSREIDAAQIRIGGVDVANLLLTSMSKYGQSSWSGDINPAPGTTTPVPGFNVTINGVYPSGFFYITFSAAITGKLYSYSNGPNNYTVLEDGGVSVSATDANGNVYSIGAIGPINNYTKRIRIPATVPFNASFNAQLVNGNVYQEYVDPDGTSVIRSQQYQLTSLNVEVAWSAV